MLNVVVFPAPFGPSNPTISPAATVIETPFTTRRRRYSFINPSVRKRTCAPAGASWITVVVRPPGGGMLVCGSLNRAHS
jgi:hypothetical protein